MKRILFVVLMICSLLLPMAAGAQEAPPMGARIEVAQEQRRSLWDMLFGPRRQEQQQQQQQQRQTQQAPQRRASLPPPKPIVEKAPDATRLAVLGDSLAIDLAKALDRHYAEDPNIAIIEQGVGSSGMVRDDYFDWNAALDGSLAENNFDIAVVVIGINDRQNLRVDGEEVKPLTEPWIKEYSQRLNTFLGKLRSAGKPVIWIGLPPMQATSYSAAMAQISSLHKLAVLSNGGEFVDTYERFADEAGNYTAFGPDINGVSTQMRKGDGIHFSAAGADKVAFYVSLSMKRFYRGGVVSLAIADPLAGTDAESFARPPFQGLGQIRLLEVAGAVVPLSEMTGHRAGQLLVAAPPAATEAGFALEQMVMAPVGRADAFGVGVAPGDGEE